MVKTSKKQIMLDEKKLLSELIKNAKENIDKIAKHCGFSRQKAWRLIKQLETQHLIWGYTAIFDEKKIDLTHYTLLIKSSAKPFTETTLNTIISRQLETIAAKQGITIESSAYIYGEYDWLLTFTAQDIIHAKKFADIILNLHPGVIEKTSIIQTLMFIKKQYILNPEKEKLKDFI
jgi:DNA-binding Lrp family transcriptional regulator